MTTVCDELQINKIVSEIVNHLILYIQNRYIDLLLDRYVTETRVVIITLQNQEYLFDPVKQDVYSLQGEKYIGHYEKETIVSFETKVCKQKKVQIDRNMTKNKDPVVVQRPSRKKNELQLVES